jgi:hypothetical protein
MAKRYIWSRFVLIVFEFNIVDFQWVTDQVDTKNHFFSALRLWGNYINRPSRLLAPRKIYLDRMPFIDTGTTNLLIDTGTNLQGGPLLFDVGP